MLKKQHKLHLRTERDFFRSACRMNVAGCVLYGQRQAQTQMIVIVSKKVARQAVRRNAIKRAVYQVLEQHWEQLSSVQCGFAIVVTRADQLNKPNFADDLLVASMALANRIHLKS